MSISAFSIRNYRFVIVLTAALVAIGVLGFLQMPRQEDPTLSTFGGVVTVIYPGASVDEIEDRVIEPVEKSLHELEEVKQLTSTAQEGVGVIVAEFRDDVDKERGYDKLVQRVSTAKGQLPGGVTEVRTRTEKPSDVVVLEVAIHGPGAEPRTLKIWADELESRLRVLDDAKSVKVEGAQDEQVQVTVDPARLADAGLTLGQVYAALASANDNVPGGVVHAGDRRLSVRPNARFETLEDVRNAVLTTVDGRPVRVGDMAEVAWGYADPTYETRYDGEPAVLVTMTQKEGRNIFTLARAAKAELDRFSRELPPGLTASIVSDQSESVSHNLNTFGMNLLQGGLIIALLVALVTGWRSAAAVVIALLTSVGVSFALLHFWGIALQQMSIAGLVIVLGLLVDNAIVVAEEILTHRRRGLEAVKAAIKGADRVAAAVASSTATTVAAFVPMMRTEGSVGEFTRDIPIVVSVVLLVSLAVALAVTPLVAARLFRSKRSLRSVGISRWVERVVVNRWYAKALGNALAHPWRVVGLALAGGAVILSLTAFVGMSFFPAAEKPVFLVRVETPRGTSLAATSARTRAVEAWLMARPEVTSITTNLGEGNPKIYYNHTRLASAANRAELVVTTARRDVDRIPALAREIRAAFDGDPDFTVEAKVFQQGPPVGLPVSVRLTGNDLESLSRHAAVVEDALRKIPGAVNVSNDLRPGPPRLDLRVDPVLAGKLGVNAGTVAREVRLALAGAPATVLRKGDDDYDVVVRAAPEGRESFVDVERMRLPVPGGTSVPLSQLTRPVLTHTYSAIEHTDMKRSVIVGSDVDGRLAADVMADLQPTLASLKLAPDESYKIIGEDEERDRAFLSMLENVIVAIGLIYGILVLQFRSFKQPLIIFTSLPLALCGSVLGLLIGGWSFGFTAFIGLLALTGIVVNNAIVLVDRMNQLRAEGMTLTEAITTGSASRLQPILMTTGTTVAGLLPLSLSGSSMWGPMGWVIIGGLGVSTLITLLLVPAVYVLLERRAAEASEPADTGVAEPAGARPFARLRALLTRGGLFSLLALALVAGSARADEPVAPTLTLADALARAAGNPGLAAQENTYEARTAEAAMARSQRLPALRIDAGYARTDDPTQTFGLNLLQGNLAALGATGTSADALRGSVNLRWVLWDRAREESIGAADWAARAQGGRVAATRSGVELQTAEAYFRLVQAGEERDAQTAALTLVDRELANARTRAEAGRALEADVYSLEARRAEIVSDRIAADGRVTAARARLAEVLGDDPASGWEPDTSAAIEPAPFASVGELRSAARENRHEVAALRAAVVADRKSAAAASAARLPQVVAEARYESLVPERSFADENRSYSVNLALQWALYSGGGISADTRRRAAETRAAQSNLQGTLLQVDREAIEAWTARETARERLAASRLRLDAAREAYRIVALRYEEGRDSVERYLGADLALTRARTALAAARAQLQIAEASVRASGGLAVTAAE
jgi:multidrug efflux pump subunit AcrB/outer membrane protein TolC